MLRFPSKRFMVVYVTIWSDGAAQRFSLGCGMACSDGAVQRFSLGCGMAWSDGAAQPWSLGCGTAWSDEALQHCSLGCGTAWSDGALQHFSLGCDVLNIMCWAREVLQVHLPECVFTAGLYGASVQVCVPNLMTLHAVMTKDVAEHGVDVNHGNVNRRNKNY
jgi:hypothetical protein